jgi:hypothetical protein
MKHLFLTACFTAISSLIIGQEVVNRNDLYEDPTSHILSQFVIEVEGKTSDQLKNSVELWAASIFNNTEAVTVAEGENYIVYKPLSTFTYDAGMGVYTEAKMYMHTKFEFKDSKIRVTITEHEAIYTSQYGTFSRITWPSHVGKREVPSEIKNKGMWKANYRYYVKAIEEKNNWIDEINSINFENEVSEDW